MNLLTALATPGRIGGRHVVVTAHADDEAITFGGALARLITRSIVQLTTGVPDGASYADLVTARQLERAEAARLGGWEAATIVDGGAPARQAHLHLGKLLELVQIALAGADFVWTHPYENGHPDHDTAAWLVQTACASLSAPPARMEFSSYHAATERQHVFGAFWPAKTASAVGTLSGEALGRKQAAIAAYGSQAHIAKKFPSDSIEPYRVAPVYNFSKPAPPPVSRWDVKGYKPGLVVVREAFAAFERDRKAA